MRTRKQKDDPNQLKIEFNQNLDDLDAAINRLAGTLQRARDLEKSGFRLEPDPTGEPEPKPAGRTRRARTGLDLEVRTRLNRVIRRLAQEKHLHYRHMWHALFHELNLRTGFSAVARGIALNCRPIAALERFGKLQQALRVAMEMDNNCPRVAAEV